MNKFAIAALIVMAFAVVQINKHFYSQEEYHIRLGKIADEINNMGASWKAHAPGRFHKTTLEQVKSLMGTFMDKESDLPQVNHDAINAPDTFDARTNWPKCASIQEVRDQATCGSCWAFGAAEAMSDRICIASDQADQTRISTEDLLDCCYSCGQGCNGGYPSAAWSYFKNTGLVTGGLHDDTVYCKPYSMAPCAHHVTSPKYPACGASLPTPPCKKQCTSTSGRTYSSDLKKGKSAYSVTGEKNMIGEISTKGPIEVALSVYEDFLTYKSGVYSHKTGQMLGGHAVKAIGYGVENNQKYWLITNSWNESWGDNGFIKILRGTNECGIEGQGVAGDV
jgi:cathepsin B